MMKKFICYSLFVITFFSCKENKSSSPLSFFNDKRTELTPSFQLLPLGAVLPQGWIKKQMDSQIESGFCRYLDDLTPMVMKDQLWGKQQRSASRPDEKNMPDVGFDAKDLQWWNGESQGNWFDGYFRTALLTGNKAALKKTDSLVNYLIGTQDSDGYIGVYDTSLRFKNFEGNGELWTQAVALRALLGYYEFTKESSVLAAVQKAVQRTMKAYNEEALNPFEGKSTGGIPHGLMFADVSEQLYRITSNTAYRDYSAWLYKAFSSAAPEDNDVHFQLLKDTAKNFIGHSAHTFEHLRVLLYAYYYTGYPQLQSVIQNFYMKMNKVILPSGIPFGFENMWGLYANPDSTAAEYCDMMEYEVSMIRALQLSGEGSFGDRVEKAFFNGMQGARFPDNKAITYDKTDNCYELTTHNPGYNKAKNIGYSEFETRYKYSPTQEDVAVCCVPNACKSYPYYVSSMWMKASDGLVATLYGPCIVKTEISGNTVAVEEKTNYPFSDNIEFLINPEKEDEFKLYFRIPEWAVNATIDAAEAKNENGYFVISRKWKKGDKIILTMPSEIKKQMAFDKSVYLQKGPIVYAYDIPANEKTMRKYSVPGFYDYYHTAKTEDYKFIGFNKENHFSFINLNGSMDNPWAKPVMAIEGMMQTKEGEKKVTLIPMGCTILRKVTFKK